MIDLAPVLGRTDIYLLDQILRGNIVEGHRVIDVGCGEGRNLAYLMRAGFDVAGIDQSEERIAKVRRLAERLAPRLPPENFRAELIEENSFEDGWADTIINSAVLHFARDHENFRAMLDGSWRLLRPNGLFFARLASKIGMDESRFEPIGDGRYKLPDGSERYLVDQDRLLQLTRELGGVLIDPIKTTVVQDQRCMTTWVLRKRDSDSGGLDA